MIICSYNGETIPKSECVECALHHANEKEGAPCGFDYSVVRLLSEGDEKRKEIHVTDLTGCLKRAYLTKINPDHPEPLHIQLPRFIGVAVHKSLEVADSHYLSEVAIDENGILGRADILYHNGRLVDFKTTKDIKRNRLPYGSHVLQLNIYAYMLRKQGLEVSELALQYIGLLGPTTCKEHGVALEPGPDGLRCPRCGWTSKSAQLGGLVYRVDMMPDKEIEDEIELRKSAIITALDTGFSPMAETGWLCTYCKFSRGECPEGTDFASRFRRN